MCHSVSGLTSQGSLSSKPPHPSLLGEMTTAVSTAVCFSASGEISSHVNPCNYRLPAPALELYSAALDLHPFDCEEIIMGLRQLTAWQRHKEILNTFLVLVAGVPLLPHTPASCLPAHLSSRHTIWFLRLFSKNRINQVRHRHMPFWSWDFES